MRISRVSTHSERQFFSFSSTKYLTLTHITSQTHSRVLRTFYCQKMIFFSLVPKLTYPFVLLIYIYTRKFNPYVPHHHQLTHSNCHNPLDFPLTRFIFSFSVSLSLPYYSSSFLSVVLSQCRIF